MRPTLARIKASAITANVARLAQLAPRADFCAVVKADGYGHGAEIATQSALAGGASWLAVATLEEASQVALAAESVGHGASVLILSELAASQISDAVQIADEVQSAAPRIHFTVASVDGIERLAASEATRSVHLKIDTGMHRMGAAPEELQAVAAALHAAADRIHLQSVWTHFAAADDARSSVVGLRRSAADDVRSGLFGGVGSSGRSAADDMDSGSFTAQQMRRFDAALTTLRRNGVDTPMTHAANSAGLLAHPYSHLDMVRVGIAIYGVPPAPWMDGIVELQPALSLESRVIALRTVERGESVSYGRHWYAEEPTRVATVPIGYADGIRRDSGIAGVEVLIRGRRCPIVGVVTMDQLMVAVPDETCLGDEVVLIGCQGDHEITATEIARRLGTIPYEVITSISSRVPRTT